MIRRDQRIDILRGVAIFLVLLHHFHLAYRLGPSLLFSNGNYAVIIFFVISGYLITNTTLRRFGRLGNVSLRDFYAFRFARIYPCLILVLLAITIPGLAGVPHFASNKPVPWFWADFSVLTFWHNVLMAKAGWFNYCLNVLWSLSVEEVFYSSFPLLCLVFQKDWLIVSVWFAAIIYAPIFRIQHANDEIQYLLSNFSCFDAIAMGCSTALLVRGKFIGKTITTSLRIASVFGMLATFFYAGIWANVLWGPTLMAASTALFLYAEAANPSPAWKAGETAAWFGRHSYELYLFHIVILAALRNVFERNALPSIYKWMWLAVYLAISSLAAWLIARWYSEPLNRKLRILLASNQQPSSSVAVAASSPLLSR